MAPWVRSCVASRDLNQGESSRSPFGIEKRVAARIITPKAVRTKYFRETKQLNDSENWHIEIRVLSFLPKRLLGTPFV